MLESQQRIHFTKTLTLLISKCRSTKQLKQIHAQIITNHHVPKPEQDFLINRLLFFCAISNPTTFLNYASLVFRHLKTHNLAVYNIMIRAYATQINVSDDESYSSVLMCVDLYKRILFDGFKPDCITFPFVLKDCAKRGDRIMGLCIHGHVIKHGLHQSLFIGNSVISFYSSFGVLKNARKVFDGMSVKDVVSWNSMIIGYLRSGDLDLALDLFKKMKFRNIITWNSIITGFVQGGRAKEGLDFFHEMLSLCDDDDMIKPDKITISSVVAACATLGAIEQGKWVHTYLKRTGLECDVVISTALIDMYGKCGCVERAAEVFWEIPKKDILAWTALISVFASHGYAMEAFDLLQQMERVGMRPNQVTFVALLSACAHSGLDEKGQWCLNLMKRVYNIEPQAHHYACMVDIFSRAGQFEAAQNLIKTMSMKPDVYVWGALLGGCQMHGNVDLGEKVARHLIDLEPLNHAFYVNLCDLYGKAGRIEDVKKIRELMKERRVKKEVQGCSLIEVDGSVYEFSAGGSGSPDIAFGKVADQLNQLKNEMKLNMSPST